MTDVKKVKKVVKFTKKVHLADKLFVGELTCENFISHLDFDSRLIVAPVESVKTWLKESIRNFATDLQYEGNVPGDYQAYASAVSELADDLAILDEKTQDDEWVLFHDGSFSQNWV